MLSSAAQPMEIIPARPNAVPGIGLKVFGFIAESVFAFIPEPCSGSSRNAVRHHPGIAFILPRIPHSETASAFIAIGSIEMLRILEQIGQT